MKDTKSLRTGIIILIGGAALIALQLGLFLPRQKDSGKHLRAVLTKARFHKMAFQLRRYEQEYGEWPSEIDRVLPTIYPEPLSDPTGNREVHASFDGTGGWVYDPEKHSFHVNLEGTVGQILKFSNGTDLIDSKPSEWKWSEKEN